LVLTALLTGCGILSRPRDAASDLQQALRLEDPAAREAALGRLRGAEPLFPSVWLASAGAATSPESALAHVDRGREFLPNDPNLLFARLSLLARLGRHDEQIAAARAALAQDRPQQVRAELLWFLIDGLLAQGRTGEAEPVAVRLGSLPGVRTEMTAAAWGRIALAYELAGQSAAADVAMQASLDLGATGLDVVRRDSLAAPERKAAANALVQRAAARVPDHPDLQLYLLVDSMAGGDLAGAQAALEALPEPLPDRLVPERTALMARVLLLQGRTEEGLAQLRARLDDEPGDPFALGVLLEAFHVRGVPSADEMARRLRASRRRLGDPALLAEVDATLKEIAAAAAAQPAR
jgi:tetratricopeptide (TPR) repeat protein